MFHGSQKVSYSLLWRQTAEVENGGVWSGTGRSVRGQFLKMREHGDLLRVEPILNQFFSGETAGSQEVIDAFLIGSQPAMEIGFDQQQQRRAGRSGVAAFGENVPELSST